MSEKLHFAPEIGEKKKKEKEKSTHWIVDFPSLIYYDGKYQESVHFAATALSF